MKKLLIAMCTAAVLAGCGSTPTTEAPTRDATPSATPGGQSQQPSGTQSDRIPQVKPPETATFDPFKDFSIYFDLNEFTVSDKFIPVVRRHADYLKKNPNQKTSVQGNTDERGSREYNISLGQKRAEAVKKLLVQEGVKEAQIEAVSLGEEKPKNAGHDETAWAENRRSDITYPR